MLGESGVRALLTVASLVGGAVGAGDRDGINPRQVCRPSTGNETAYDFQFQNVFSNAAFNMAQFRGKLTLAVNYHGLNALQSQHGAEGFQVVGFPCNQFRGSLCPATTRRIVTPALYSPVFMEDIRWNFEKFLIGPDGRPIYRYSPDTDPATDAKLQADIRAELAKMNSGYSLGAVHWLVE
ncbi:GPX-like protein [Mya arenaria]|uniref:GPX-like protein n=1 Tax=Mya arenaria TaxID=6604 RepID=A0ABY7ELL2_MYAAR|nr:GPX-like protein [Mya arenaria]